MRYEKAEVGLTEFHIVSCSPWCINHFASINIGWPFVFGIRAGYVSSWGLKPGQLQPYFVSVHCRQLTSWETTISKAQLRPFGKNSCIAFLFPVLSARAGSRFVP